MSKTKRTSDLYLSQISQFHNNNLYLPTRTIYFGGNDDTEVDSTSDEVNSLTVAQIIRNLHILETKQIAPISLLLNTLGGSWEDGIAVYDLIQNLKSPVNILAIGKVYSMGSIIFQAGTKRILTSNTLMMIHDGTDGYIGDSKSFEAWAKNSKKVRETMYKIYYERIKEKKPRITLKDIEEMCSHDTIFTAKEAVKIGLADRIL